MNKARLRAELKRLRGGLPNREQLDAQIAAHILSFEGFKTAGVVMAYKAIGSEPSLDLVLAHCRANGIRLALPRVEGEKMVAVEVFEGTAYKTSAFRVQEPEGQALDPNEIDLILCPGLGFTRDGLRLGYGKGYYDYFLMNTAAKTVGVCYTLGMVEELPADPWDRRMDYIVNQCGVMEAF